VSANPDIGGLLAEWPHDPRKEVRLLRLQGGRQILQVRLPLGVEQHELDGRPDGRRPYDKESALDYHEARLSAAAARGEEDRFHLGADECAELFEEGVLYYFRYLRLFQVEDWARVVRDTARNLRLFDFVRLHAAREQDRAHLEQWRPYILRMHAIASAMSEMAKSRHAAALDLIGRAVESIEALQNMEENPTFKFERDRSVAALREMAEQIRKTAPEGEADRLERELLDAVKSEQFERAAELRDRIRQLPDGGG